MVGKVNVDAHEYIQSNGIKIEARVFESFEEPVWVTINNQRIQEMHRVQNVLYSRDVQVTGPSDLVRVQLRLFHLALGYLPVGPLEVEPQWRIVSKWFWSARVGLT